jgi:1-acyl-sn-glycerol-3-phosphate acyltransferase
MPTSHAPPSAASLSLFDHARRVIRVAGFGGVTSAMLPAFTLHQAVTPREARAEVRNQWVRVWSDALLRLFNIRPEIVGTPPAGGGRLVVANHRSTIDIAILLRTFGGHMVSRADLARWPLIGAAARSVGTIFVDRSDAVSGATTVRAIRELLRGGETVCIFPEGTTFPDDDVRPFHTGAFVAALHTGAQIVPVGIAYESGSGAAFVGESFGKHLARMSAAPGARVAVRVGSAIEIGEKTRAAALRDQAREAVQALVVEARAAVDGA